MKCFKHVKGEKEIKAIVLPVPRDRFIPLSSAESQFSSDVKR